MKNVMTLAQNVLPHTAPQGRDVIVRDTEALRADWEAFILALAKVSITCKNQKWWFYGRETVWICVLAILFVEAENGLDMLVNLQLRVMYWFCTCGTRFSELLIIM